jgi:predicted GNAT family acetyltransferase
MNEIKLVEDKGQQAFILEENNERIAEMVFAVSEKEMIVYHTEVSEQLEGQGIGKKLIEVMAEYAQEKNLKVVPLCPYVLAQFKKYPEQYKAIWKKD